MDKLENFRYFCHKLIERYDELGLQIQYQGDFGRLAVMKMLFFSVVASNEEGGFNKLIDTGIFNKFYALPNGPIESDCYGWIYNNSNFEYKLKNKLFFDANPEDTDKEIIRNAIVKIPKSLFRKNTFELVDISHRFSSWIQAYREAVIHNKRAWEIKNEALKTEDIFLALF